MSQAKSAAIKVIALLSLHDLEVAAPVRLLLRHIRANDYLPFTVYRDEMKQSLSELEDEGYVHKSEGVYGVQGKGLDYLCELAEALNSDLLSPSGRQRLANFVLVRCSGVTFEHQLSVPTGTSAHAGGSAAPPEPPSSIQSRQEDPAMKNPSHQGEPAYSVGQQVVLRSLPGETGIVVAPPFYSQDQWHYQIFFSGDNQRVFRESDLAARITKLQWVGLEELHRNLALVKLQNPLSNNLYALYASRTQFAVYQFRPALKFLGNPDQRLLIADEVGLGKTIEAGIIYLELQARLDLNRVLVVCPSGLRHKWQDELKLRFDEEFLVMDADSLRRFVERFEQYGGNERLRGIASLELIRRPEFAEKIEQLPVLFDLVIIDEAHHCRNTSTRSHALATILSDNADAMLLLTATPLQTRNEDLFHLLRILSPGEFDNVNVFEDRLEPNEFVNRAAQILATGDHRRALQELKRVELTRERRRFTGNPYYSEIVQTLSEHKLSQEQLVSTQRRLVELNTLANVFTRTRKREIAEKVPTRSAFTLTVEFSPGELEFYNRVIQHARDEFAANHGSSFAAGWATIMYERLAASCISAARERFAELADNEALDLEEESLFTTGEGDEDRATLVRSGRQTWYHAMAKSSDSRQADTKFDVFQRTLRSVLDEDGSSKVIVFAFFRGTVEYLYRRLRAVGVGVEYLHGGIAVNDRPGVIDRFRQNPEVRVLVSSDVGSEGLDFQFCNTIFNYDLPWNPMKVEQRIGRIDRFGQQSDKVRIFSLVIDNSIESRILLRLYDRIGLFQRAIGDIEAILGEQIRELSRQVYTLQLTPGEQVKLAEQASQNVIRLRQEMEEFEQQRLQFMGQDAIFSSLVEQTIESGNYMSEREMLGLVKTFIRDAFPRANLEQNKPADGTFCIEFDAELADYMRRFAYGKRSLDNIAVEFLKILDPNLELPVTFSSDMASERKLLHFITPRHPLARAAADYWRNKIDLASSLPYIGLMSDQLTPGSYYFFIFLFESHGAENSMKLVPVVVNTLTGDVHSELSRQLLRLIQTSAFMPNERRPAPQSAELEEAESMAMMYMTIRRDQLERDIRLSNEALVNARLSAVTQSYHAKRQRVEESLAKPSDRRIVRMRQGQLNNMRARYESTVAEIEQQRSISVSFALVLRGFTKVASLTAARSWSERN